jgi:hypothetical protein
MDEGEDALDLGEDYEDDDEDDEAIVEATRVGNAQKKQPAKEGELPEHVKAAQQ